MKFWDLAKLKRALGEEAILYNFPENWTGNGVRIWHTLLEQDDIVFVRSGNEIRGAVKANIIPLLDKISAIICTNHEEFMDLNIPIIEVKDFTRPIFLMGKFVRSFYNGTVVAITGSAGKSTTTRMIYDVLEEYGADANLNLANTLVAICWNMTTFDLQKKYWVIESSIGNGYAAFANIAVVTNLAAVHLKEGQTLEGMAKGKSRIFSTMKAGGFAILNKETKCYEIFEKAAMEKKLNIITVGVGEDVDVRILAEDFAFKLKDSEKIYKMDSEYVPLHLLYDIALTIAVAKVLNISADEVCRKLKDFKCLQGRGETLKLNVNGKNITLIDEAFNANPLSMSATIEAFGKKYKDNKILVLGDMAEGGDKAREYHLNLVDVIKNSNPRRTILCGVEMKNIYEILKLEMECYYFENVEDLIANYENLILDNHNIFVKSSHSTGLFKFVNLLKSVK